MNTFLSRHLTVCLLWKQKHKLYHDIQTDKNLWIIYVIVIYHIFFYLLAHLPFKDNVLNTVLIPTALKNKFFAVQHKHVYFIFAQIIFLTMMYVHSLYNLKKLH